MNYYYQRGSRNEYLSGRKTMLQELIPMTESILVDSDRNFGKRQNGGRTDGKDRTRDEEDAGRN